jgi:hypothetical protein
MKKIFMTVIVCLALFCMAVVAEAGTPYGVELTTFSIAGSTQAYDLGAPMVSGTASIMNFVLSNSAAVEQTITVYKNATSTTAVTEVCKFILPASVGYYRPLGDMDLYSMLTLSNFTVRKSSTGSEVYMYVNYKK